MTKGYLVTFHKIKNNKLNKTQYISDSESILKRIKTELNLVPLCMN